MTSLTKEIRQARPSLRLMSPLVHWILVTMAAFNILLGMALFLAIDADRVSAPLLIVNEVFNYKFWGVTFILLGIFKIHALFSNRWNLARASLLMGVSIKSAWAIALTIRAITSPGTLLVNLIWISLAAVQMGAYIFFMPPEVGRGSKEKDS